MKDTAYVLFKNNTGIKKRLKNPQKSFELEYVVDGKKKKKKYQYDRDSTIILPSWWVLRHRVSFYEEGNPKPLTPNFKAQDVNMEEIQQMIDTDLIKALVNSAKDNAAALSIGVILGLGGIAAIVLIAVFG